MFENDLTYLADKTMVVYTQEDIQLQRLMERNQLTETDAKNRMNAQMALKKKCELADAVIDNSGTIEYTAEQLEEILNEWGGLNNQ
ncbi:dephospho-CoA kinase [Gracilibacillus boraciitolerans JCM 21714]|uniref:Dephospho-CoA kinase n=1 Tax=Gracilibacillus boraciitolerans JCM 21714 TaxID=1298598 RepID=W4VJR4_9BACI|nr:dephospho-CoA kinase [Gracilibacillus boraciitolerans JCM 21714]